MTMDFTVVDFGSLIKSASPKEWRNIFQELGADDCGLCKYWSDHYKPFVRSKSPPGKISTTSPRTFAITDLVQDPNSTPKCCQFLACIIRGTIQAFNLNPSPSCMFEWDKYKFVLKITDSNTKYQSCFQIFSVKGFEAGIRGIPESNGLYGDTSRIGSLDQVNEWIRQCEEHPACQSRTDAKSLPQRLIDVTPISKNGKGGVRIAETGTQQGIYAILSHCWGDEVFATLLKKDNEKDYLDFIPYEDFPKTFQDAITITRHLKLDYLWIDSLCLKQDDKQDRAKQTGKMDEIYGNSFIVIAAVASNAAKGGCFSISTPDKCLKLEIEGEKDLFLGVRKCSFFEILKDPREAYKEYPLFERAWTYQERVLASRLLYCNRTELAMECGQRRFCECGANNAAPHINERHGGAHALQLMSIRTPKLARIFGPPSQRFSGTNISAIHDRWQITVIQYSALKLRNPDKDILRAFSGCAKVFQSLTGHEYLAGLWRQTLKADLLWRVVNPWEAEDGPAPTTYRAPSWSWARVSPPSGVVFFNRGSKMPEISLGDTLEEASCTPASNLDPTGKVTSGILRLKSSLRLAHVRSICLDCKRMAQSQNKLGRHRRRPKIETDKTEFQCEFEEGKLEILDGDQFTFHPDGLLHEDSDLAWRPPTRPGPNTLYGVCRLAPVFLLHVTANGLINFFLVLKKAAQASQSYERVGLIELVHKSAEAKDKWFSEVWSRGLPAEESVKLV